MSRGAGADSRLHQYTTDAHGQFGVTIEPNLTFFHLHVFELWEEATLRQGEREHVNPAQKGPARFRFQTHNLLALGQQRQPLHHCAAFKITTRRKMSNTL